MDECLQQGGVVRRAARNLDRRVHSHSLQHLVSHTAPPVYDVKPAPLGRALKPAAMARLLVQILSILARWRIRHLAGSCAVPRQWSMAGHLARRDLQLAGVRDDRSKKRLRVAWISAAVGAAAVAAVTLPGIVVADAAVQPGSGPRVHSGVRGSAGQAATNSQPHTDTDTHGDTDTELAGHRLPPATRRWCTAGSSTAPAISAG